MVSLKKVGKMGGRASLVGLTMLLVVSTLLAGCGSTPAPAAPTSAPPAPTTAAAAPTTAPAAPTTAPAAPTTAPAAPTTAPAAAASAKDSLVIAIGTNIATPDNHKATGLPAIGANSEIGDVLVRLDPDGNVIPWLIESWEWSDDSLSLTLKVRDNVKMHDGNTMNAEDVRYSIERFRTYSVGKAALDMVTEVTAVDDSHVRLTTEAPFAPLLRTLAYTTLTIYSKAAIEQWGDDDFGNHASGPGPYKLVDFKPGDQMVLEAFEDYWAGAPKIKNLTFRMMPEMSARILALESGDVDLIDAVVPQEAERLSQNDKLQIINPPSAGIIQLYLNQQKGPLTDKLVRQAIYYAIDREAIVKNLFLDTAEVAHSPAPPGAFGYTGDYDVYAYNPDKAKQLLQEAGAENLKFTLLNSPGRYMLSTEVSEAIKAQLAQVGVDMEIQDVEWGTMREMTSMGIDETQMQAVFFWWRSINGDADSAIADYASKFWPPNGNNTAFFKNDEYDQLYESEKAESDPAVREQMLMDMQKILMDELPSIVLYRQPNIWAAAAGLVGVEINALSCLQPLNEAYFQQ